MPSTEKTIVFITGACGTLGKQICQEHASPENHLILLDQDKQSLKALDDALASSGVQTTLIPLDLTHPHLLEELAKPLLEKTSRLHKVYSCHGVMHDLKPTDVLSPRDWHETLTINLTSNYYLARLVLPFLRNAPHSQFTFFSCPITQGYDAAYAVSKAGLKALVASLQKEQTSETFTIECIEKEPFDSPLRRKAFPNGDPRTKVSP